MKPNFVYERRIAPGNVIQDKSMNGNFIEQKGVPCFRRKRNQKI